VVSVVIFSFNYSIYSYLTLAVATPSGILKLFMQYLKLERALNSLTGKSTVGGAFYGMAGALENIIKVDQNDPDKLANDLANLIEDIAKDIHKPYMTTAEYAKWKGISLWYTQKLCRMRKLPGARKIGREWVIE